MPWKLRRVRRSLSPVTIPSALAASAAANRLDRLLHDLILRGRGGWADIPTSAQERLEPCSGDLAVDKGHRLEHEATFDDLRLEVVARFDLERPARLGRQRDLRALTNPDDGHGCRSWPHAMEHRAILRNSHLWIDRHRSSRLMNAAPIRPI
jgi:hypothetical protein